MNDGYVLKSSVLNAIHNGDIDMGMVTLHEYYLLKDLSERIDRRIQRVPVVDVQPVRHGRWQITEGYPHNVYCSECHARCAQTHWTVWEDGSLPRVYCPNCGAKMDLEE